jgi:tetratricopeptide (TPR) repeat protein
MKKEKHAKFSTKNNSGNQIILLLSFACAFIGFILYANTLNHEYAFDDFPTIYGNRITMMGFAGIPTLLKTAFWYGLDGKNDWLYRPLSMVMFATEWGLAPNKPALSHWVNVSIYALTGFCLFRFLFDLLSNFNVLIPLSISVLWLAHPIHTEVVANIKSRDELMCFLFSILYLHQILKYVTHKRIVNIIIACVCFFLSLMSKESGITILAATPLMLWCFTSASIKSNLFATLITLIPAGLYIFIRSLVLTSQLNLGETIPLIDNSLVGAQGNFALEKGTAFYILGRYLLLLFFPHPMSSDYSFNAIPLVNFSNPIALVALLLHIAAGIYAITILPKRSPIAFGILFYLATLSVVANVLFLTRSTMADRFLYMPSLGFCLLTVMLIAQISKLKIEKVNFGSVNHLLQFNKTFTYVITALFVLGTLKTWSRNTDWKNDTTIFSADVEHEPNSSRLRFLYGNHMIQDVKQKKVGPEQTDAYYAIAETQLKKCIEIHPDYFEAYFGLGDLYVQRNNMQQAMMYYKTVVERLPNLALGYNNLGNMYFKMQQYDSAIIVLQKAIILLPDYADAYNNLGSAFFGKGDYDNAIKHYTKTIELSPTYVDAWKNLGSSYGSKKEYDKSIEAFNQALALSPNDADIKKFLDMTVNFKNQASSSMQPIQ